uniref:Uncharacterized protein n=1 Tax=Rhizochromulina marina TaxID=1034831 RepID=A0A7S2SS26_9STRA|mmetsp:Transcript_4792/g.14243  ORF Transcript_4792/g.14243 Transcript_4792/m.14243 type:complete len:246 (+) Transcript_4792:250-987(+)
MGPAAAAVGSPTSVLQELSDHAAVGKAPCAVEAWREPARAAARPQLGRRTISRPRRNVTFGMVETRLYQCSLGDHPWVSTGVPVALTDDYVLQGTVRLPPAQGDDGAGSRKAQRCRIIPPPERLQICLDSGVSPAELEAFLATFERKHEQRELFPMQLDQRGIMDLLAAHSKVESWRHTDHSGRRCEEVRNRAKAPQPQTLQRTVPVQAAGFELGCSNPGPGAGPTEGGIACSPVSLPELWLWGS